MELILNLGWFVLALALLWAWLRFMPQGPDRSRQFVALALLVFILLPAISMTDDLLASQHPAEVDTCLRRAHEWLHAHIVLPAVQASIAPQTTSRWPSFVQRLAIIEPTPRIRFSPATACIDNRPPPAA